MNSEQTNAYLNMKLACEGAFKEIFVPKNPEEKAYWVDRPFEDFTDLCESFPEIVCIDNHFLLQWACFNGQTEIVKYLHGIGGDIRTQDDICLKNAAENGHLYTVHFLVSQGANIHSENDYAVRSACRKNFFPIVDYLVKQGANIHANEEECVRVACKNGNLKMVEFLFEHGADIHVNNEECLRNAAYHYKKDETFRNMYYSQVKTNETFEHEQIIEFLVGKGSRVVNSGFLFEFLLKTKVSKKDSEFEKTFTEMSNFYLSPHIKDKMASF